MALGFPVDNRKFSVCRGKAIQVLLSVCGLLLCMSYGLMFGWPCHYFAATFRDPDPLINIPFNVAPLLAGNLMMGYIAGTILSYFSRPNAKYAMVIGGVSMTLGWGILWQSQNIAWFFASRQFIGLGLGLTTFNLKTYIEDICDPNLSQIVNKFNIVFQYFGIFLSTIIGYLEVDIPTFGLYAAISTLIIAAICIAIPQPPRELYRFGDVKQARWLRSILNPNRRLEEDLAILDKKQNDYKECNVMWIDVLTKSELRWKFLILFVSCFLQQFTGMPATIVFGEFIYEKFEVPNPNRITIFYMIILITVFTFSVLYNTKNKKCYMMISSTLVCLNLLILIILFHFNVTTKYPVVVVLSMYLYIIFHTIGLGSLTGQACIEMFPPCYKHILEHFLVMFNATFAIIVGKTFQILYDKFNLYGPFSMYTILSGVAILFIWLFIHKYEDKATTRNTIQIDASENGVS